MEKTIQSVINQSYQNIEYIVIDGGSTDGSHAIIEKYKKFINYLKIENDNGIFHAVDKGIKKSSGEYIIWINSDDILNPKAAENIVSIFKNNPNVSWINGRCGYIKNNIQFSFIPYVYPKNYIEKGKEFNLGYARVGHGADGRFTHLPIKVG